MTGRSGATVQRLRCDYGSCREPALPRMQVCQEHWDRMVATVQALPVPKEYLPADEWPRPLLRLVRDDERDG